MSLLAFLRRVDLPHAFPALLALALPSPLAAAPQDELASDEIVEGELGFQLDEYLTRLEGLGFAGIVGVEHQGQPVLLRGYGAADRERGTPVTPRTVFTIGSITKQFTAAAVLALLEDGRLALEDPLTSFFEDVPEDKRGITLQHLLTHTSGLVDPPVGDFDLRATADWVRDQAFGCKLLWAPGTAFRYMNVNYSLAGMIVERVSGRPYEDFLRERLLEPAGLHDTGYRLPGFAPERLAQGYVRGERWGTVLERPQLADGPCWTLRANGGIHSTVGDMLRWSRALESGRVLKPETVELLQSPQVAEGPGEASSYAYGWSIQRGPSGSKLVCHNGGNGVFFADLLRYVDDGWTLFVATGVGATTAPSLAYDLAALVFGRAARLPPETLPRDEASLAPFVGRYRLAPEGILTVENGRDRLRLGVDRPETWVALLGPGEAERLAARPGAGDPLDPRPPVLELFPLEEDGFCGWDRRGPGARFSFERDEDGRVRTLRLASPSRVAERE